MPHTRTQRTTREPDDRSEWEQAGEWQEAMTLLDELGIPESHRDSDHRATLNHRIAQALAMYMSTRRVSVRTQGIFAEHGVKMYRGEEPTLPLDIDPDPMAGER